MRERRIFRQTKFWFSINLRSSSKEKEYPFRQTLENDETTHNRRRIKSTWISSCVNEEKYGTFYVRILYRVEKQILSRWRW